MSETIKTLEDVTKACDRILYDKNKDNQKKIDELHQEITYLKGQADYIRNSPYIPKKVKYEQLTKIDIDVIILLTKLYLK